jgi:soluble lytic murein transglycosylase-like protein
MKPDCRLLIVIGSLFVQLVYSTAGADSSAAEALHAAYVTKLFALETRLAVLSSQEQLTSKEKTSFALLKTEHERLRRRVKVSKRYVLKRPFNAGNRMERGRLDPIIIEKSWLYGVNPDFVHAIIKCESNYNSQALSRAGAMGLMQLMPETAADLGVENPWSPTENIDGGVRYIRAMLKEFREPWKVLVSYNCGPEILRRGLPIPAESRRFAGKVLRVFTNRLSANDK